MSLHSGHRARKKQQFLAGGGEYFADHELLELILFFAIPRKDTNPSAHLLLKRFGSFAGVFQASEAELAEVPGIGKHAARLLHLFALFPPLLSEREKGAPLTSVRQVGAYLLENFAGPGRTGLYALCFDAMGHLLSSHPISADDPLGDAVRAALLDGAVSVVLARLHPQGMPATADDDIRIATLCIQKLGDFGIKLNDYFILGETSYISLCQTGVLYL